MVPSYEFGKLMTFNIIRWSRSDRVQVVRDSQSCLTCLSPAFNTWNPNQSLTDPQMYLLPALSPLLALLSYTIADALGDFANLQSAISTASQGLTNSVHFPIQSDPANGTLSNTTYTATHILALTDPFVRGRSLWNEVSLTLKSLLPKHCVILLP